MPARKKPAGTQQGHRQTTALALVEGGGFPVPELLVKDALPETLHAWNLYWSSPVAGRIIDVDLVVLQRYFWHLDQWRRMATIIDEEGAFTKGSMGQTVEHPAAKLMATHETALKNYEAEFGIGVRSRHALGITIGQAQMTAAELNRKYGKAARDGDEGEVIDAGEGLEDFETA